MLDLYAKAQTTLWAARGRIAARRQEDGIEAMFVIIMVAGVLIAAVVATAIIWWAINNSRDAVSDAGCLEGGINSGANCVGGL
jgi:flagellar basal body-associated protein FliL